MSLPLKPILRSKKEIDSLYDCLELISNTLCRLQIPFIIVAGSLLGSLRSSSFLFCDDDIDIAVFENDYERLLSELPAALGKSGTFTRRPFPAADRVRPRTCTQVWVDVFVLRRYDSLEDIKRVVCIVPPCHALYRQQVGQY